MVEVGETAGRDASRAASAADDDIDLFGDSHFCYYPGSERSIVSLGQET